METITELIERGLALEEIARADRRSELRPAKPEGQRKKKWSSEEVVAPMLGLSESAFYRLKAIYRAAVAPDGRPEDRTRARLALELVDQIRSGEPVQGDSGRPLAINGVYDTWRGKSLAASRHLGAAPGFGAEATPIQRQALANTVSTLKGLCFGIGRDDGIDPLVTAEEAAQWQRDLSTSLRVLRSLNAKLKEHADASGN